MKKHVEGLPFLSYPTSYNSSRLGKMVINPWCGPINWSNNDMNVQMLLSNIKNCLKDITQKCYMTYGYWKGMQFEIFILILNLVNFKLQWRLALNKCSTTKKFIIPSSYDWPCSCHRCLTRSTWSWEWIPLSLMELWRSMNCIRLHVGVCDTGSCWLSSIWS